MSGDTKTNHWVRRRGYSKVHVKSWTIYLEKNGYVKCPFQNCNFMAFDVEEMYQHYSVCNGDSTFAKFVCSICQGRTVTAEKLKNHKLKAHDVTDVESIDLIDIDNDENSNDDTNDSTIKKAALSKVVILSWKCSLEENKYIKCPECDYLEKDVSAMVNHYLDCKKDSVVACYVCPECKGKAVSFDILQCHMSYAHKVDISKMNFNKISPRMVQIWYDEIAHNKFARCLHKTQGALDCLYFDTGISGIILHYQACTGVESTVGTRHTCAICKHWTDSEEKIKVHVESCHVSPLTFVSRYSDNTTRNSKNFDMNNCFKSNMSYRDFKMKIQGKSVRVDATTGKLIFKEEGEMGRRKSIEEETSIMRDSIGYNLFDEVEVIDNADGKTDDVQFVSADVKHSVQPLIDLPPDVSDSTSTTYCIVKEEDTFLHSDLLKPPVKEDRKRYKDAVCEDSVETEAGMQVDVTKSVESIVCTEDKRRDLNSSPKQSITKPLPKSPHTVDLSKINQNVKLDNTSINTLVLSEEVDVSSVENNIKINEKLEKNNLNNSMNSSSKINTECQQEFYKDDDRLSVEMSSGKNYESETVESEKTNTVCNYVVELCNEDENKDVLCFKITDLEESETSMKPEVGENAALPHDMMQSSKLDISFESDEGSVKNVYVVSTDLADTDAQNTTTTDESSKTVNDSSKMCTPGDSSETVNLETPEVASSVVGDYSAGTLSSSQDDNEPPRLVQFFKKGNLNTSALEKKKVVCVEYRKGALFRNRLFQPRRIPVFDDKEPSCSGVEIERRSHSCFKPLAEASSGNLIADTGNMSTVVSETTNSVGAQISDSEPELVPIQKVSEPMNDNSAHVLKNINLGSKKIDCNKTVVCVEDGVKGKQELQGNKTVSEKILHNKEKDCDIDRMTVYENSYKIRQKKKCELDSIPKTEAFQLDDLLINKSSSMESDIKLFVGEDGDNIDHKRENNLFDSVKEVDVVENKNIIDETVCEGKVDSFLEECSGKDETATSERPHLKNEEVSVTKQTKNVGVRVSFGVQIQEMSVAKLRKIKKPIKNLVRKLCKEELRKYRSSKKYFHSKRPIKNSVKRIQIEDENAKVHQPVEEGHAKEEVSSACLPSKTVCEENTCKNLQVEESDHNKPENVSVSDKIEEITDKVSDLNNIHIYDEQSEEMIVDSGNQIIKNTADVKETDICATVSSEFIDTECEIEPAICVPSKELSSSSSLKKYIGKKDKMTNDKDAMISENTVKKVDKCLNKDEMKNELSQAKSLGTPEKQESNISKTVTPEHVDIYVLDELKTSGESNNGVEYLTKKTKVKEYSRRSSLGATIEGQDKTMKCDSDKTLCFVGDNNILPSRSSVKSESPNNSEKEEILNDSTGIEESEMNLVRKVKYVDELEANYSSKKTIVNNVDVDDDNDNEEILIYLTEEADCETGTQVERTNDNVNSDKTSENVESAAEGKESSQSVQVESTDKSKRNEHAQSSINTSTVIMSSDSIPLKRRRGRPSKQEMLQRKLNESMASDLSSQVINDATASSTPNTLSRPRRRTCISRRYLEDDSPQFSYSERRKRSRNQPVWYMTPETSNDSTDSSQHSSKRGRFLRTSKEDGKDSSSEDEDRNYNRNEPEINKDGDNQTERQITRVEQPNLNDTSMSSEAAPVKRKRGRPRKNFNVIEPVLQRKSKASVDSGDDDDDDNVSLSLGGDSESESSKRRPVIKTKTFCKIQPGDVDSSSLQSVKDNDRSVSLDEKVKCGKCGEEMSRKEYIRHHKMKHYNLCWLEGEEPIDYANQDEVVNLLQRAQKKFRMKMSFKCETCGVSKKSAVGFQSHLVFCGKSKEERDALMESCSLCGRIMMPSSLKVHMGVAHNNNKPLSAKDEEMQKEEEMLNFVREKRAAATKAESALQDSLTDIDDIEIMQKKRSKSPVDEHTRQLYKKPPLNASPYQLSKWKKVIAENGCGVCYFPMCYFQSNDIEILRDHSRNCPHAPPKVYSCRHCDFECGEETEMVAHVRDKHEDKALVENENVSEESSLDDEGSQESLTIIMPKTTPYLSKYPKLKFVRELGKIYGSRFFHQALKLTYDMREENFSKDLLFNAFKPICLEWRSMEEDEIEQYLPKTRTSVRLVTKSVEWHQIQLFECDFIDGVLTLFVGGPVWAASWAPVSDADSQQYLAIACHPDMDLEHAMGRTYKYKSLIQIWKFDQLDNMKNDIPKPKLIYGIAHNHGAVWSLEWCPSGCFQDDRIGIFAAACSDGFIYIYSVPREDANGSCKICKPKPSAVLNLGSEMLAQCTRLTWHKVKPHSVIAAGFASGMVGLWDLNTKSPLLYCNDMYYPYHVFQPHQSSVSGLSFGPSEVPQYLATASVDCSNKFWDLRDTTAPVNVHRKGCVTDLVWMQNWLSSVSAYDEVYGYAISSVLLNAYRDFCYLPCSLSPQIGVTWSLSSNDWMNSIACGDETGRVIVSLPLQIAHIDEKKVKKNSKLALLNTLHDFGEIQEVKLPQDKDEKSDIVRLAEKEQNSSVNQPENAPSFLKYNEAVGRYGLSLKVDKLGFGIDQTQSKPVAPLNNPNMYPLTSITKVSWNTNFRSFVFLAAGFHCGIVVIPRTTYIKSTDIVSLYRKRGSTK